MGPAPSDNGRRASLPTVPSKPTALRSRQDSSSEDLHPRATGEGLVAARISALSLNTTNSVNPSNSVNSAKASKVTSRRDSSVSMTAENPSSSGSVQKLKSVFTQTNSELKLSDDKPKSADDKPQSSESPSKPPIPARPPPPTVTKPATDYGSSSTSVSQMSLSNTTPPTTTTTATTTTTTVASINANSTSTTTATKTATVISLDESRVGRTPPHLKSNLSTGRLNKMTIKGAAITSTMLLCFSATQIGLWDVLTGECKTSLSLGMETITTATPLDEHRFMVGSVSGNLHVINTRTGRIDKTMSVGGRAISHLFTTFTPTTTTISVTRLWAMDEAGWLHCWSLPTLKKEGVMRMIANAHAIHMTARGMVWVSAGKLFEVYTPAHSDDSNPTTTTNATTTNTTTEFTLIARFECEADLGMSNVAMVVGICSYVNEEGEECIITAHEDGTLYVWRSTDCQLLSIIKTGVYRISSMMMSQGRLWIGYATGKIAIIDPQCWSLLLEWKSHHQAVVLLANSSSYNYTNGNTTSASVSVMPPHYHPILSVDSNFNIGLWDAHLEEYSIDAMLAAKMPQFCHFTDVRVQVCSWNVDAQRPPLDDVFWREWTNMTDADTDADVVVFGLQEVVDLESTSNNAKLLMNAANSLSNSNANSNTTNTSNNTSNNNVTAWLECINSVLQPLGYVMLTHSSMVGLLSVIMVRETLVGSISQVTTLPVKTGLGGLHGNKGALVTRFLINHTSVAIINCHLAAGHSQIVARNTDASTIVRGSRLPSLVPSTGLFLANGQGELIADHEHCILFGDLNYRLEVSRPQAEQLLATSQWSTLHSYDQLLAQVDLSSSVDKTEAMIKSSAMAVARRPPSAHPLSGFREMPLNFAPTYKYDRNTNQLDSSEKQRVPAYCDRILFRLTHYNPDHNDDHNQDGGKVMKYRSHPAMMISDHRPISASLHLTTKVIDWEWREVCLSECRQRWLKQCSSQ